MTPFKLNAFIEIAAGIASLAHKYEIKNLYDEAIKRIGEIYPSSFSDFDARNSIYDFNESGKHLSVVLLINVARRTQAPELDAILPCAFYVCCQFDPRDGFITNSGTVRYV